MELYPTTTQSCEGKTLAYGGFTSPRAPAGNYKVVIKKGRDTYEQSFVLSNDPTTSKDSAYFEAKQELTMTLYDMTQELAYMVYELDALLELEKNKRLKSKLEDLKETLVITTGDNYVGAAEPQLREKMADLYAKVAESYSKPSPNEKEFLRLSMNDLWKLRDPFKKTKGEK